MRESKPEKMLLTEVGDHYSAALFLFQTYRTDGFLAFYTPQMCDQGCLLPDKEVNNKTSYHLTQADKVL